MMKYLILLTTLSLLFGCQSNDIAIAPPQVNHYQELYLDDAFQGYELVKIPTSEDVFTLDAEMKSLITRKVKNKKDINEKAKSLLQVILQQGAQSLNYDINANTTAKDTFYSRKANCLSLTILAYSLAKEANINVKFQDIKVPEYWVNNGEYSFLAGHVNLVLTSDEFIEVGYGDWGKEILEVDFSFSTVSKEFRRVTIKKDMVLAMLYNNIAAQAIVNDDYVKAYALLKNATKVAADFSPAWGNLGILYRRLGYEDMAAEVYRYAIKIDPNNLSSMTNLANVLSREDNNKEINFIENLLDQKRKRNPYYFSMLAEKALSLNETQTAERHYQKAISLDPNVHDFYFGLAKVYAHEHKFLKARKFVKKAMALNKVEKIDHYYENKLAFLSQAQARY